MNFTKKRLTKYLSALALFAAVGMGSAAAAEPAALPAADTTVITAGVLSSTVRGSAGEARTSDQMTAAEQSIADEIAREAARKAAAEQAAAAAKAAAVYTPSYGRQVVFSSANTASAAVKANGRNLGTFRLSFYCPCSKCCGKSDGITKTGTYAAEGRTIAVDPRVIPLGSRVYIEGYGDFIAEDIGGVIKSNKIDVFVSSHSRCYQLGIAYANVYLM